MILEVAVNGATPRSTNRHVPWTPAEVGEDMLACVARGASIAHDHHEAMFVPDGVHPVEPYLETWAPVLAAHPDQLLYPTMAAGARGIPIERRWAHVEELARRGLGGLYFGGALEFGLPPTTTALEAYLEMQEPSGLPWSVAVLDGDVVACGLAETAVRRGSQVRVGLEDCAGPSTPTNVETRAVLGLPAR